MICLNTPFPNRELLECSVIRNFRITAADGKANNTEHNSLAAVIAVEDTQ
jgi:hypothetical protein